MKKVFGLLIMIFLITGCNPDDLVLPESVAAEEFGVDETGSPIIATWYKDVDVDGYGGTTSFYGEKPEDGSRWILRGADCDDHNTEVNPGLGEDFMVSGNVLHPRAMDRIDNNCDGKIDAKTSYVFITTGKWDGNLGGLVGADEKCQNEAVANDLPPGNYKAFLSDYGTGNSVSERLVHSAFPYVTLGNVQIARDWDDMVVGNGNMLHTRNQTLSTGEIYTESNIWTGSTDKDGNFNIIAFDNAYNPQTITNTPEKTSCDHWTNSSNINYSTTGVVDSGGERWPHRNFIRCNLVRPLMCIRQITL